MCSPHLLLTQQLSRSLRRFSRIRSTECPQKNSPCRYCPFHPLWYLGSALLQ